MPTLRIALPLSVAITLISFMIYGVAQQSLRQSFDDAQIRAAEDAAALLQSGVRVADVMPKQRVDIGNSISPWLALYSATGTVIQSNGVLGATVPQPPTTIFTEMKRFASTSPAQKRITWQPQEGIRQGLVIVTAGDTYVVAGRNMRDVEQRIWNIGLLITLGWLVTLVSTLLSLWAVPRAEDFITYIRG